MRQYTVAIAVKLVPVLKSLTSSQPHDTTSMVHVQELPQRNMNLPESILNKEDGGLLALLAVLIRISVANEWLKKLAEQNYIYAEELLADKYYEGVYIVKDVKAAIYWYEKAANQGSVYAMYRAGYIYYSEPIDYNKAGQWFSLAAEKGDKDAEEVLRNNLSIIDFTKNGTQFVNRTISEIA